MKVGQETPLMKLFELRIRRRSFTEAALIELYADGEEGLYIYNNIVTELCFTTNARFSVTYFHVYF